MSDIPWSEAMGDGCHFELVMDAVFQPLGSNMGVFENDAACPEHCYFDLLLSAT